MLALGGCGGVTPDDVDGEWPLTVRKGEVRCEGSSALVFTAPDGTDYALNGTAATDYPDIDPIWKNQPGLAGRSGLKVSLDPLMALAREQC